MPSTFVDPLTEAERRRARILPHKLHTLASTVGGPAVAIALRRGEEGQDPLVTEEVQRLAGLRYPTVQNALETLASLNLAVRSTDPRPVWSLTPEGRDLADWAEHAKVADVDPGEFGEVGAAGSNGTTGRDPIVRCPDDDPLVET